jgi:hypothetical protein
MVREGYIDLAHDDRGVDGLFKKLETDTTTVMEKLQEQSRKVTKWMLKASLKNRL